MWDYLEIAIHLSHLRRDVCPNRSPLPAIRDLNTWVTGFCWELGLTDLLPASNAARLAVRWGVSLKCPRPFRLSQLSPRPLALTGRSFHYENRNLCPKCCYITDAKYLIPRGSNYGGALATPALLFNNNCKSNRSGFQLTKHTAGA